MNKKDFGEQLDEFTSVYRKDFDVKICEKTKLIKFDSDYPDIIAGPHKDYLLPDYFLSKQKSPREYEQAGEFYNRLIKGTPKLKRNMEDEVDQDLIKRIYQDDGRSIYQIDYCRLEDGLVSKKALAAQRIELPSDWGDPPLTTQKKSYRDPMKILMGKRDALQCKAFKAPKSELEISQNLKDILKIRTGESEYQSFIGLLGNQVTKDHYHGSIELLPNEYIPD